VRQYPGNSGIVTAWIAVFVAHNFIKRYLHDTAVLRGMKCDVIFPAPAALVSGRVRSTDGGVNSEEEIHAAL